MRIGIDARFYGASGKGLGRYVEKLLAELEKLDNKNEYFVFLRKDNFAEYRPGKKNFKKILADYRWYSLAEQFLFPFSIYRQKLDLMHFTHFNVPLFYRRKFIVTVHDLILLHFPTIRNTTLLPILYKIKYFFYKIVIFFALKRAQKIITVSNFTKKDIENNYPFAKNKTVVTYESGEFKKSPKEHKNKKDALKKYGIIKKYLLYIGNAYPHKNLENLLLAWKLGEEKKWWKNYRLVLAGGNDYFYRRLRRFAIENKIKKVIFAGFVSDNDLPLLYQEAEMFVFPSLYEGFGLPPLEAMRYETPVVSSDSSCLPEILGEAAFYFNAKKPADIAQTIKTVLLDKAKQETLKQKGKERIRKYSWQKMAEKTLYLYDRCRLE